MEHLPDFAEISENLQFLEDWEDRYRYIIELGALMPAMDEGQKTTENKVSGCVSQVWIRVEPASGETDPVLQISADSDAMIVKGLAAILVALYSGHTAQFVAKTDAVAEFDALGLKEHLTSQRANGLVAMVGRIRSEAQHALAV